MGLLLKKKFLFTLIFLLSVGVLLAQSTPLPPGRTPPPGFPIDGGLLILGALAAGYGAYKKKK